MRRTIIRYVNLSSILVLRLVASQVHDRFPTYESLVKAGILLQHEKVNLETMDEKSDYETSYMPIVWAMSLIEDAQTEGKIKLKNPVYANLLSQFDQQKERNRVLFNHGWINFPLAYTQVT